MIWGQNFDRNNVGVAFGPYTKYAENGQIPWFNSYSVDELKRMLAVINTKFTHIATYGMGVSSYNVNNAWDNADSSALIARAAANLNRDRGQKAIDVAIGIYQSNDRNIQNAEVNHAFDAADDANGRFGGTAWGLVFLNEYIVNDATGQKVLGMIRYDKNRAHNKGLKVGTRIHVCGEILNRGSHLYQVLSDIARESDFIMCNMYPASDVVHGGAQRAVDAVGNFYLAVRKAFRDINGNLDVLIGETGWASEGQSFNNAPNSVANLKDYWTKMAEWASRNSVRTYMFEAMDEPFKSGNTAERHFGWWYRKSNNDEVYVEKASNREIRG